MKTVIATIIEKNEYRIKIDVENDATEDEIWDAVEEVYWKDDYNNMAKVDSNYNIKIKNKQYPTILNEMYKEDRVNIIMIILPARLSIILKILFILTCLQQ